MGSALIWPPCFSMLDIIDMLTHDWESEKLYCIAVRFRKRDDKCFSGVSLDHLPVKDRNR